jgi:acylphosphatase
MNERVARRLVIHGRVQGVWYRESMRQEAERLGIAGWVRNRVDGTVEAIVEGDAGAVAAITDWARRGPRDAEVRGVDVAEESVTGATTFEKRYTG